MLSFSDRGLGWRLAAPLTVFLCLCSEVSGAGTRVYSCQGENGEQRFQQRPCASGAQQEHVYEDYRMGWEAPPVLPKRPPAAERTRSTPRPTNARREAAAEKKKCFAMKQKIEGVNRRLRRGYKPAAGEELRHKRRQYEDYLSEFCR
jgi:hypothetical protein